MRPGVEPDAAAVLERDADDFLHRGISCAGLDDRLRFLWLDVGALDRVQGEKHDAEGCDGAAHTYGNDHPAGDAHACAWGLGVCIRHIEYQTIRNGMVVAD